VLIDVLSGVPCWVLQVIECRRILKWTYAYGYYTFEDEDEPQVRAPPAVLGPDGVCQGLAASALWRLSTERHCKQP